MEVARSISSIVAMLSVENVFYTPRKEQKEVANKRKKFLQAESDHLTLLNVYNHFEEAMGDKKGSAKKFCRDNYLNEKSLKKARKIKWQLDRYLEGIMAKRVGMELPKISSHNSELVIECLVRGLPLNTAEHYTNQIYKTRLKEECAVHPSSVLSGKPREQVIYSELIKTTRPYLKCVTDASNFISINRIS